MQTSNQPTDTITQTKQYPEPKHIQLKPRPKPYFHGKSYGYLLIVLCLFATLGAWIMQNSINAYYLQTYHKSSPLSLLDRYPAWKMGGDIGDKLYAWHGDLTSDINQKNQQIVDYFNNNLAYTPEYQAMMAKSLEFTPTVQMDNVGVSEVQPDNPYVLHSGDEYFFCWRLNDARRRTTYPAISYKKITTSNPSILPNKVQVWLIQAYLIGQKPSKRRCPPMPISKFWLYFWGLMTLGICLIWSMAVN
ncbi:hypothetical protein AO369_0734 [Moraxella catarrhalis]|nr:hypothetical protein AO369_0734 [Moraxella catarrhalis]